MSDGKSIVERLRDRRFPGKWSDELIKDPLSLEAADRIEALEAALKRIERWQGEFPETGLFWPSADGTPSDRPMSYGSAYGSNGERDYMREVARSALQSTQGGKS